MNITKVVVASTIAGLAACANTTAIQPAASSKSQFAGATFGGQTVTLNTPTPGAESYRVFHQGATGFVSLQTVRSDAEERATAYCERQDKVMRGVTEIDAKPPYILGNFPRVELLFECSAKPQAKSTAYSGGKFERLAQLKILLDNGTLTQQEFEREKAKILAEP